MRYLNQIDNIHAAATIAKNRMRSNFWNTESIKADPVKFATQKAVYGELMIFGIDGIDVEKLFDTTYSIITAEEKIINPIGRMIDRAAYEKMTYEQKQRYVLKLSGFLHSVKCAYYRFCAAPQ